MYYIFLYNAVSFRLVLSTKIAIKVLLLCWHLTYSWLTLHSLDGKLHKAETVGTGKEALYCQKQAHR